MSLVRVSILVQPDTYIAEQIFVIVIEMLILEVIFQVLFLQEFFITY